METVKTQLFPGAGGEGMNGQSTEGFWGNKTTLCDTIMVNYVSLHICPNSENVQHHSDP